MEASTEKPKKPKTSNIGIELIKSFEGCKLKAYKDAVGVWTIGYGSTDGVVQGMVISQAQADELLIEDIIRHERYVDEHVTVPLADHHYAALSSFTFNVGGDALKTSTLLKHLNKGEFNEAALQFHVWCRGNERKILPGLLRRRQVESHLFLFGVLP